MRNDLTTKFKFCETIAQKTSLYTMFIEQLFHTRKKMICQTVTLMCTGTVARQTAPKPGQPDRSPVEPAEAQPEPRVGFRAFRLLFRPSCCAPSDRRCHVVSFLVAGKASSHPISLTRGAARFPGPHLGPAWRPFRPKIGLNSQILSTQSR